MVLKNLVKTCIALCISAVLATALCGCDDLGEYEDAEQYYGSFESVYLLSDDDVDGEKFSVAEYFYNDDSRENFLTDEEGNYDGVDHNDYVYMAIPFESTIDMDAIALYIRSESDVSVYINAFVTGSIPSEWKPLSDIGSGEEKSGESSKEEKKYDDPAPETRIGERIVHLKGGRWGSFVLDSFNVSGSVQKSIQINKGQYVLLQIRNNSGIREFNEEKQAYVDPQTGLELPKAKITMTNLLIRALENRSGEEAQGGE